MNEPFVKSIESVEPLATSSINGDDFIVGIVIVSPTGKSEPTLIRGPKDLLEEYNNGNELNKSSHTTLIHAAALSAFAKLLVVRSLSSTVVIGADTLTGLKPYVLNDKVPTVATLVTLEDLATATYTDFAFIINGRLYYRGTDVSDSELETVEITGTISSDAHLRDAIIKAINENDSDLVAASDLFTKNLSTATVTAKNLWLLSDSVITADEYEEVATPFDSLAADATYVTALASMGIIVVPAAPRYSNDLSVIVKSVTGSEFTVTYDSIDYAMSTSPTKRDSYNRSLYWDRLNELGLPIKFIAPPVKTADPLVANGSYTVGVGIGSLANDSSLGSIKAGLYKLEQQEGYRLTTLSEGGYVNLGYLSTIATVAENLNIGVSIPCCTPTTKTKAEIKMFATDLGIDSSHVILHAPFNNDPAIIEGVFPMSPSYYYIKKWVQNKARNAEFAPIFSRLNGSCGITNPVAKLSKADREELLEMRVNTAIYDKFRGTAYFNNNLTAYAAGGIMSEDQSRRIASKIAGDVDYMMEQFISRFNIAATRSSVLSVLKSYKENTLDPMEYTVAGFRYQCDELNNTASVINKNELRVVVEVQHNRSVKYVIVYQRQIPVKD